MKKGGVLRPIAIVMVVLAIGTGLASAEQRGRRDKGTADTKAEADVPETFAYLPASDRNLRITVNNVVLRGDPEFIPRANNWVQINMTITNVGRRTLSIGSIQGRLASGTLFATAQGFDNILREPSLNQMIGSGSAAAAGGMAAGYLIFPPAAIVVGIGNMVGGMINRGRRERRQRRYLETILNPGPLAPGTNVSGNVYLPALRGQTALIVFYTVGGSDEFLEVRRTPANLTLR